MTLRLIIVFFLTNICFSSAQTTKSDKKELTYFYVGDGCPICNDNHPEKKYGFVIKCVGCEMTPEIKKNNDLVIKAIDKRQGMGWTCEFIKTYCADTRLPKSDEKRVILKSNK